MSYDLLKYLSVTSCGKVFCKPDWRWTKEKKSKWNNFDLWTIIDGKGAMVIDGVKYELSSGDCFFLRDGISYIGTTCIEQPLVVIYSHFNYCDSRGVPVFPDNSLMPKLHRKISNFPFFSQILERIAKLKFERRDAEAADWLKIALLEIKHQDEKYCLACENSKIANFIQNLCRKIRERPEKRFKLKDEARKACYSTDHFSRLFKESTDCSFREYILRSRMNAARMHLTSTVYSIGRIAEILGYNDIYLFSRQFKKETGLSPSHYRASSK